MKKFGAFLSVPEMLLPISNGWLDIIDSPILLLFLLLLLLLLL